MRFVAIDPGKKRVGFASGDDETRIATPLCVVRIGGEGQLLEQAACVVREHEPDAIVMGLAVNMDGTEGPAAKEGRLLAKTLEERLGLPVHLVDERLTSFAADERLKEQDLSRSARRQRHDAFAAAAILERYFAS